MTVTDEVVTKAIKAGRAAMPDDFTIHFWEDGSSCDSLSAEEDYVRAAILSTGLTAERDTLKALCVECLTEFDYLHNQTCFNLDHRERWRAMADRLRAGSEGK